MTQGAYYLESNGEVAIIDPLRDVQPYSDRATKDGATIKYVLETHFHANFVSGYLDLSRRTGAPIVYGPNAQTTFITYPARDGEELRLGAVTIRVLHTPGQHDGIDLLPAPRRNGQTNGTFQWRHAVYWGRRPS